MGTSSRYRILFPKPDDKRDEVKLVSHWIFSMNGLDFMVYYKDGKEGRGFVRHSRYEFPPQWKYVNDRPQTNSKIFFLKCVNSA